MNTKPLCNQDILTILIASDVQNYDGKPVSGRYSKMIFFSSFIA